MASSTIPFVGCPGEDMEGPENPPSGEPVTTELPPSVAAKLALYVGQGLGFLAPRGWRCESTSGSSDIWLWASPQTGNQNPVPVITLETSAAETGPGTSLIQSYCSQYFQDVCSKSDFLKMTKEQGSILEGTGLKPRFHTDTIKYIDRSTLAYETPGNKKGLGTLILSASLFPTPKDLTSLSSVPTYGLIELINNPGPAYLINLMAIRLPPAFQPLRPYIVNFELKCPPFGALMCDQTNFQEINR